MIMLYWGEHILAAKHKVNTYSETLFPSDDCASIWSWPPMKLWRHVKPKNKLYAEKIFNVVDEDLTR